MKVLTLSRSLFASFCLVALVCGASLTGCSASELTGPDTEMADGSQAPTATTNAMPNEGNGNKGGGTTPILGHNTMPSDD